MDNGYSQEIEDFRVVNDGSSLHLDPTFNPIRKYVVSKRAKIKTLIVVREVKQINNPANAPVSYLYSTLNSNTATPQMVVQMYIFHT